MLVLLKVTKWINLPPLRAPPPPEEAKEDLGGDVGGDVRADAGGDAIT